jgi:DNA-binding NtrC family response regulator
LKKKGHILIIDDDTDVLFTAKTILKREFENITTESTPNRIESLLKKEDIDVVLLDMNFKAGITSGNEGLFWLRKIQEIDPDVKVVMSTAYGDIQLAVETMKLGAVDFLVKPWEKEKLLSTIRTVFELSRSNKKVQKLSGQQSVLNQDIETGYMDLVFASEKMQELMEVSMRVAATDASVLILGENGTGKELIAREIHRNSLRKMEPLIKVDLGAISRSLFESELFGHVKGAFTDAKEDKTGRFEAADGGTLFMDEIGNLDLDMQVKLLSVLQNQVINKVGSSKERKIDVRIISATNQNIAEMVDTGEFRQDLLYRINTVELEIPPLRERPDDIPVLTRHFLKKYSEKYQRPGLKIDSSVMKQLSQYDWPGNVRELQHAVERAVIMSRNRELETADFIIKKQSKKVSNQSLKVEDVEKNTILKALEAAGGNMSRASEELGIGRTTLYRKMKKYGI